MSSLPPAPYSIYLHRHRVPQQVQFSQPSASSGMQCPPIGDAGAYMPMRSNYQSYTVPNVSGHQAAGSLQSNIGSRPVDYTWVDRAHDNLYPAAGRQDAVPSVFIAQSPATHLSPSPVTPSSYTDPSDSSLPPPSPMETSSPYPPPAGQSAGPLPSFPTRPALTRRPSFEAIQSDGSSTRYRCRDCPYQTHRRSDMRRHRDGSYHSKKKYYCPHCEKSYTRRYKLDEHERKHYLSNN